MFEAFGVYNNLFTAMDIGTMPWHVSQALQLLLGAQDTRGGCRKNRERVLDQLQ